MRLMIFFNPNSGSGESKKIAAKAIKKLDELGYSVTQVAAPDPQQAVEKIVEGVGTHDGIIAIGGDGSLNLVAQAFLKVGKSIPMLLLPAGTVNNFAKTWDIPLDTDSALELLTHHRPQHIGIGVVNEKFPIISSCVFGNLAETSNEVAQSEKQRWGKLIYVVKALKLFATAKTYRIHFKINSQELTLKVWSCLMTTNTVIGGIPFSPELDNKFHVFGLTGLRLHSFGQFLKYLISGRRSSLQQQFGQEIETMTIIPPISTRLQLRIDGDPGPELPANISWYANFLTLWVPEREATSHPE